LRGDEGAPAFPAPPPPPPKAEPPRKATPPPPAARARPKEPPPRQKGKPSLVFRTCTFCGEMIRAGSRTVPVKCPSCGTVVPGEPVTAKRREPPPSKGVPVPELPAFVQDDPKLVFTQEDDGRPYPPINTGERRCPECNRLVAGGVAVCGRCGFNLDTGEPASPKRYPPLNVAWDAGMAPRWRYTLFFTAQTVVVSLG